MAEGDPCGWCGEPSVTEVVTVPGRKKKKVAPVCEAHAAKFEGDGVMTTRVELAQKMERDRKRSQWKGRWTR